MVCQKNVERLLVKFKSKQKLYEWDRYKCQEWISCIHKSKLLDKDGAIYILNTWIIQSLSYDSKSNPLHKHVHSLTKESKSPGKSCSDNSVQNLK